MTRLVKLGTVFLRAGLGLLASCLLITAPALSQPTDITVDFNGAPLAGSSLTAPGGTPAEPVYTRPTVNCNTPGFQPVSCRTFYGFSNDQTTPIVQETIRIDGFDYYHLVVKDPRADFSTEYYIRYGYAQIEGNVFSDSGGGACIPGAFTSDVAACVQANNARNPLSSDYRISGNGTGIPDRVEMRQVNNDAATGFSQVFLKNKLATKPIITQTLDNSAMTQRYVMDMSGIDYNTDSVRGSMTNSLNFKEGGTGPTVPNFDYARFSQNSGSTSKDALTAGRYTFARFPFLEPGGTYTYFDGTIDRVLNQNWAAFRDPTNNPQP